jgi:PadR family transcriptional regulator PadR
VKPHVYFILLALAGDDRHGLGIAREVTRLSDGDVRLWPATLYGSLDDLAGRGWIEELVEDRPAHASEKQRFYRLTQGGRIALGAETDRLSTLVRTARARIKRAGEAS